MHDVIVQLLRYARGTWRYRWWMLTVAWIVCLIGWSVIARMPDQFQATARVYVDTSSVLRPYLDGLAMNTTNTEQKIFLMTRSLLSQPNLEKVTRMADLDLEAVTEEDKENLIADVKKRIKFSGTSRENLYTINFQDESPERAKLVVKSLLTIFMEGNQGDSYKEQDNARQFIEKQVADFDVAIRDTELKLARFKQENLELLPSENGGYHNRLRELKDQHAQAKLELSIAEDRLQAVQRQIEGEVPDFGIAAGGAGATMHIDTAVVDQRIQKIQERLDDLLLRYTEKHPDVMSTRRSLKALEGERREFITQAKAAIASGSQEDAPPGFDLERNPVYQQMRINISELEAEVAAKRAVAQEFEQRLRGIEGKMEDAFALDNERLELERVLTSDKEKRAVLLARLDSAELGRKADTGSDGVRFRVIDPPRSSVVPSGPPRVIFSVAVLLAGLGAGFALAFLMSQFRPTYDDRQQLGDELGLPVLGSVDMVWTSSQVQARRVRNVSFVFTLTGLLVVFGTVLALYQFNLDLLPRLAQSLNLG